MKLSFLIVDTYYGSFLKTIRNEYLHLSDKNYSTQKKFLLNQCFGTSDFYSHNLKKIGHDASEIIANDEILQRQWARENGLNVEKSTLISRLQELPLAHKLIGRPDWVQDIALAQIKKMKPDIVYMQDLSILNSNTLKKVKKYCKLLVGQIACPLPAKENLLQFDLIITSFPHYVSLFKLMGIKSEYVKLCFEPRILKKLGKQKKIYDVSFVGSFTPQHAKGTKVLEEIAKKIPIHVWGRGGEFLLPTSPLKKYYHGEAWGLDMYKILSQSKITINRHIDVAKKYANNMRLFEATGSGAMLLTDKKENLGELFKIGKEVVDYTSVDDLYKKILYYLENNKEREDIAKAGQARTLSEHVYRIRMKEIVKVVEKYL